MKYTISFLFLGLIISACSLFKPAIPSELQSKLDKVFEDASTLNAMTEQGVNFNTFGQQLAKTKGDYDLAVNIWPADTIPETRASFDQAFTGWYFAYYLWNAKITKLDTPTEPNINKFDDIITYAKEENLLIEKHDGNFSVEQYRGKRYLPFDKNISILLAIASDYYKAAQTALVDKR